MPPMNRREAVKATAVVVGGVLVASNGLLLACSRERERGFTGVLSADDERLVEEIADTLLPDTPSSPGAKAAGAGAAINLLLTDCYAPETQVLVVEGLKEVRALCERRHGDDFASLARAQREQLLRELDAQAQVATTPAHHFAVVRDLAVRAYFSSEVGMTRALRYTMNPGRWVGCVPLVPGQPAWA